MYSEKPELHKRQRACRPGDLRVIALDITSTCNMKCSHCYAETFVGATPVPLDVLARAAGELYRLGVFHYVFQGGEPILVPDRLEAILKMCRPDETYYNVVTNGWEMTREKIEWLKSLKVDKITFSMDSGIREEHDANRRPGSFDRTVAAINHTLEAGLLASVDVTVTHRSLHSEGFRAAYEFATDKGIRIDIQIAEPVGKWDGRKELLLTPEDSQYIKKLQMEGPILKTGQRMVNRDIFTGEKDHCIAATEFLAITVDGQALPCNFLQFSLGNIRDKTIVEMRRDIMKSEWFNGRQPVCICGEDMEFVDKFITPHVNERKPLDAREIFNLKEKP